LLGEFPKNDKVKKMENSIEEKRPKVVIIGEGFGMSGVGLHSL